MQWYYRKKRPNNILHASHLSSSGPKHFGFDVPDLWDETTKEAIFLHGCAWHMVSMKIHNSAKQANLHPFILAWL